MATEDETYDRLLRENRSALRNFEARGVELGKVYEIEFTIDLQTKEDCQNYRIGLKATGLQPKDSVLMLIDDPKDYHLVLHADCVLDAHTITDIEHKLCLVAEDYPDAEVSWGFFETNSPKA